MRAPAKSGLAALLAVVCCAAARGDSLRFNVTYDASTLSAPSGFFTAFSDAVAFVAKQYDDPITINIDVGWGEIAGRSLNPGDLGQSLTFQPPTYSYSTVKSALIKDSKSGADATAVAHLPASDPTGGKAFAMSNAEAKALGLIPGNATGLDGYVGFLNSGRYTFDPNARALPGGYDFVGLAEHELTEVMGRYGLGQNGASSGRYSPIDLFRYTSPGVLDLVPENGDYFSIDGGKTVINIFNGTGGGDLSDWSGATLDSFNAFLTSGKELDVSAGDLTEMDVLGYDVATSPAPEPSSLSLGLLGLGAFAWLRQQRGRIA